MIMPFLFMPLPKEDKTWNEAKLNILLDFLNSEGAETKFWPRAGAF